MCDPRGVFPPPSGLQLRGHWEPNRAVALKPVGQDPPPDTPLLPKTPDQATTPTSPDSPERPDARSRDPATNIVRPAAQVGVTKALGTLHRNGHVVDLVLILGYIAVVTMIVGALLFEWLWFAEAMTYRFLIPMLIGVGIPVFISRIYARNLERVYDTHLGVMIVWLVILIVLSIWALVDIFVICPDSLPDYCTDGVDPTVETGYWVWSAAIWAQTILYFIEVFVVQGSRKAANRLKVIYGLTEHQMLQMLAEALKGRGSRWVKAIGGELLPGDEFNRLISTESVCNV